MSPAVSTALPDLVMTLARRARSMPAMPMADSRPPMVVGIRQTNSEMKAATVMLAPIVGDGLERGANDHENEREARKQDGQRDFVRSFLARGTFDQGDHLVEETLARLYGHFYENTVGENLRTARDGAFVAARLADHRGRFARDGAFVDRRQALDDLAVGRNRIAGNAFEQVALFQLRAADDMRRSVGLNTFGGGLLGSCAANRPAPCRLASAMKSSTPACSAMYFAVSGLSPVTSRSSRPSCVTPETFCGYPS